VAVPAIGEPIPVQLVFHTRVAAGANLELKRGVR
jgi:hypothetical protein